MASKLDVARKRASSLRRQVTDLEDECDNPPLTTGRVFARIGKFAIGNGGAMGAGMLHGRDLGPMKIQTLVNVIGTGSGIAKIFVRPDGWGDLLTEAPLQAMRGNLAIAMRNMRDD